MWPWGNHESAQSLGLLVEYLLNILFNSIALEAKRRRWKVGALSLSPRESSYSSLHTLEPFPFQLVDAISRALCTYSNPSLKVFGGETEKSRWVGEGERVCKRERE